MSVTIRLRIDQKDADNLTVLCKLTGVSASRHFKQALMEYMERQRMALSNRKENAA